MIRNSLRSTLNAYAGVWVKHIKEGRGAGGWGQAKDRFHLTKIQMPSGVAAKG